MTTPTSAWIVFWVTITVLFVVDLLGHRGHDSGSQKSAIVWSVVWVAAGLAFSLFVWATLGGVAGQQYIAAYLIEKSLSLDNLFVFLVIFRSIGIPRDRQHTVLIWGIIGALVFRAIFVFLGIEALERWDWVSYVFGALLLYAAYRSLRDDPSEQGESKAAGWLARRLPVTDKLHGSKFFVKHEGRTLVTPLLIALFAIEVTDIVFAVDSVPAALSVSSNPFIVYSSNAFAILGLRALYLVMATGIARMRYLGYGLAGVLTFAAFKLIAADWLHVPALLSVGIIVVIIGAAVIASVRANQQDRAAPRASS